MTTVKNESADTPLMRQYHAIKQQHADALLLFQVGDFYELFFDDAKTAASFLGIALTTRGKHKEEPIPLCGVPVHALDHYLAKLIRGGFRVALCDQLSEPIPGKVVERGVTQVLTPGTLTDTKLLDAKSASYLFSFYPTQKEWSFVVGELLTAQLFATVVSAGSERMLEAELARFFPDEIVIPAGQVAKEFQPFFKRFNYFVSQVEADPCLDAERVHWVQRFGPIAQEQITNHESLACALKTFYAYMYKTQQAGIEQFSSLTIYQPDDYLILDAATQHNLELLKTSKEGKQTNTLFWVLDGALTPMGSRMIKKWIVRPLLKKEAIEQRQHLIKHFVDDVVSNQHVSHALSGIGDLERVVGRIALNKARLHDYHALGQALAHIPRLRELLLPLTNSFPLAMVIYTHLDDCQQVQSLLATALNDDVTKEWLIRKGFDQQLDYLRDLSLNGQDKIMHLEQREQQATGIGSLKIRYNHVQGYYIEITKTHSESVPAQYVRVQTLAGRERFSTLELQRLQQELMYAQAEASSLEKAVFDRVVRDVIGYRVRLRKIAYALAHLDALIGLARVASHHGYVCPVFNDRRELLIEGGRHPIVERTLDNPFIPNDTQLTDNQSLLVITGPNMGGKSTYLRQVALISIMAQCGSLVPARSASLPLFDRIFTRIGAGDNLAEGKSTFLIEMEETAAICHYATRHSLVILDEVGRGTSTMDGLAIAQSVIEYIYTQIQARCLFATHYHELTVLEHHYPGIKNYHTANTQTNTGIVLLHKIIAGSADGSFGIEVAKRAELPPTIITRAMALIHLLMQQQSHTQEALVPAIKIETHDAAMMHSLMEKMQTSDRVIGLLRDTQCDDLSPRQAFDLVCRMKTMLM